MKENRFTLKEVAEIFSVSPMTVWRWVRSGKLEGFQMVERGQWYIKTTSLKAHFERMGLEWRDTA